MTECQHVIVRSFTKKNGYSKKCLLCKERFPTGTDSQIILVGMPDSNPLYEAYLRGRKPEDPSFWPEYPEFIDRNDMIDRIEQ